MSLARAARSERPWCSGRRIPWATPALPESGSYVDADADAGEAVLADVDGGADEDVPTRMCSPMPTSTGWPKATERQMATATATVRRTGIGLGTRLRSATGMMKTHLPTERRPETMTMPRSPTRTRSGKQTRRQTQRQTRQGEPRPPGVDPAAEEVSLAGD